MKHFLIALQFLTVFPVKIGSEIRERDLGASLMYFPAVGIVIGAALSFIPLVCGFLPGAVVASLVIIASLIMTGAIHVDGFADTCDGLFSGKPKDRMLEIMRDSRIGTMGAVAVASLLLLKFSLLISMTPDALWKVLIVMATFARWCQCLACVMSDYAREDGKAKHFIKYAGTKEMLTGGVITFAVSFLLLGVEGVVLLCTALPPVLALIWFIKRKLGGMTGDTIGAINECAEVILLFSVALYIR